MSTLHVFWVGPVELRSRCLWGELVCQGKLPQEKLRGFALRTLPPSMGLWTSIRARRGVVLVWKPTMMVPR